MILHLVRAVEFLSDPSVTCAALAELSPMPGSYAILEECLEATTLAERYRLVSVFPDEALALTAVRPGAPVRLHEFGRTIVVGRASFANEKQGRHAA